MAKEQCPLCGNNKEFYYKDRQRTYYLCSNCKGISIDSEHYPGYEFELARYNEHNNDVADLRYQKFVGPIVQAVLNHFGPKHSGLDFGAGTGPVISALLHQKGYQIVQYDPFFHNFPELLQKTYDYIVCCEVIEHFHHPAKDFELLRKLLNTSGKLFCMTNIYSKNIDFNNWYYKNDITHVFFYQAETLEYIRLYLGFSRLETTDNLIIFSKD